MLNAIAAIFAGVFLWLVIWEKDRFARAAFAVATVFLLAIALTACGAPCEPKPCEVPASTSERCACGARECTACLCDSVECNTGATHTGRVVMLDCATGDETPECAVQP